MSHYYHHEGRVYSPFDEALDPADVRNLISDLDQERIAAVNQGDFARYTRITCVWTDLVKADRAAFHYHDARRPVHA